MIIILCIFIVLDTIYQIFGSSISVEWTIYYNLLHYLGFFAITIYYAYKDYNKLAALISLYFLFKVIIILTQIGLTRDEYFLSIRDTSPVYIYSIIAIFILLVYVTWTKLKKAGR